MAFFFAHDYIMRNCGVSILMKRKMIMFNHAFYNNNINIPPRIFRSMKFNFDVAFVTNESKYVLVCMEVVLVS